MPYTHEHKRETRARIVQSARQLFNRRGFADVSIDEIMAAAGLTRGGFYNHFRAKEDLYAEILFTFARDREELDKSIPECGPEVAVQMVRSYVSRHHLNDVDDHCPLMALPSDVARAGPAARGAYQRVLEVMVNMFEGNLEEDQGLSARRQGLALAATCVGALVLARTIDNDVLADELCDAAREFACNAMVGEDGADR